MIVVATRKPYGVRRANRVDVARIPLAALIDQLVAAMEVAGPTGW